MHIIKRELRANLKSLIIWMLVIVALVYVMNQEFSAYYDNPEMAQILDSIPEGMMKAFGFENANLTTTVGFVSLASFYFYLLLGVHAILLGSGILSKEERDKTAEFFLTFPVSREKVILTKYIAGIINCVVLLLALIFSVIGTLLIYELDQNFYEFIILLAIALFMMQMIFLSIGFFYGKYSQAL
jgi:ABC-2 type transport system permease protein